MGWVLARDSLAQAPALNLLSLDLLQDTHTTSK